jgi:hypothetical protein
VSTPTVNKDDRPLADSRDDWRSTASDLTIVLLASTNHQKIDQRNMCHLLRSVPILLLCLFPGACSSVSDLSPDIGSPPDPTQLKTGIMQGISDSHFSKPIEVSDVFRAPPSSTPPWMICIRSATSDEAKRLTYSVFYGKDASGKDGQYLKSRYSVYVDNCGSQTYHPFDDTPSPSPVSGPKKHHKRDQ